MAWIVCYLKVNRLACAHVMAILTRTEPDRASRAQAPDAGRLAQRWESCFGHNFCCGLVLNVASWRSGESPSCGLPTALLVGVLLCTSRRAVGFLPVLGYFHRFCINLSLHELGCGLLLRSAIAGGLSAALFCIRISPDPDVRRRRQLLYLLLFGVVIRPRVASFFASFSSAGTSRFRTFIPLSNWLRRGCTWNRHCHSALSFLTIGAPGLRVVPVGGRGPFFWCLPWVAMGVFSAQRYPILFLINSLIVVSRNAVTSRRVQLWVC